MLVPTRVQRSRAKGATTPANTKYCGRPGKFGNPFTVHQITHTPDYFRVSVNTRDCFLEFAAVAVLVYSGPAGFDNKEAASRHAVKCFGVLIERMPERYPVHELAKYKHLSCWCKEGEACHVDEILKRLNHVPDAGNMADHLPDAKKTIKE